MLPEIKIDIGRGKYATISAVDFDKVSRFSWCAVPVKNRFYARCYWIGAGVPGKKLWMHRLVADAPEGKQVDHINGDPLDNRRENLRICSNTENNRAKKRKGAGVTSQYRGVSFEDWTKRWKAQLSFGGKNFNLGRFDSQEAAARAYDAKARELFGEFACPNFPL